MNILMIPSWYENINNLTHGSFFREQAEALEKLGHEVYVLYVDIIRFNELKRMIKTSKFQHYTKNNLKVYRIKKVKLPKIPEKYVCRMVTKGIEKLYLDNIYKKVKIDVIHAHSFVWGGYAAVKLGKKYNIPVAVTEHYTGYSRNIFSDDEKNMLIYAIRNADKVISVSSGLREDMLKITGVDREIHIIPNMVDTDLFKPSFNEKNKDDEFKFLAVCYLMKKKGIDILIRAFKKAMLSEKKIKLTIVGDGEEKNFLKQLAKDLGIEGNIEFLGSASRIKVVEEMKKCDCFVLPSRFETFGVVYIEALCMGKPVIATNTDAIADIVNDSNGLIVDIEDVEGLTKALIKIKREYQRYNFEDISYKCIQKFGKKSISQKLSKKLEECVLINK